MLVLQKNDPLVGSIIGVGAIWDAFDILLLIYAQVLRDFELNV